MVSFSRLLIICLLMAIGNSQATAQAFWNKPDGPKVIRDNFQPQPEPIQPKKKKTAKKETKPRVVEIPDDALRQAPGLPQTAYRAEEPKTRGLFQILFGAREEAQPFREEQAPIANNRNVFVDPDSLKKPVDNTRTVCVRLCDGAFMPISTGRSTGRERDADVCQAQCPGADTKVFSFRGDNITDATSRDGESYMSLANANKFKNSHDKACSCRPAGKSWAEYAASMDDPTLRGGDKFLTEQQAKRMALAPQSRKTLEDEAAYKLKVKQEETTANLEFKPELQTGTIRTIEVGAAKRQSDNKPQTQSLPPPLEEKGLNPVERLLLERNVRRPAPAQKSGAIENKGREG